jgi:DNA polymerase-1
MQGSTIITPKGLAQWLSDLDRSLVACDTETSSLKQYELELLGVSLCDGRKSCYVDLLNGELYESFIEILRQEIPTIKRIVFHNAPFDMRVLYKAGIKHTQDIVCTMTAAFLLDENNSVGLKELAVRLLGESDVLSYDRAVVNGFKSKTFYEYARHDAEWTWALWRLLGPQLDAENLSPLFFDVEMPFQYVLRDLEINGVLIDQTKLSTMSAGLHEEIGKLQLDTYTAGGINYVTQKGLWGDVSHCGGLNLDSPEKLSEFIRSKLGIVLTEQSDTGSFSVDKHVLSGLANQSEFVRCLLQYREAVKLQTMFLDKAGSFIDGDGRIRASFNNCVARTGRLSSSGPNLQQLPKKGTRFGSIRSLIVAPPGYSLVSADYAGQELRVLAEVSRDLTMIESFIAGKDLHLAMANKFFQLGIPESCLYKAYSDYEQVCKQYKKERDKSKIINFGIAYGKTEIGFSQDWNIPVEDAKRIIENYFAAAPRVKGAIDACKRDLDSNGYVCNLAGRRRRLVPHNNHSYRQAFNFLIQGFSADLVKKASALALMQVMWTHPEWDCKIIMQVHDELVFELLTECVPTAVPLIKYVLEHAWDGLCIPMAVDIHSGHDYSECK